MFSKRVWLTAAAGVEGFAKPRSDVSVREFRTESNFGSGLPVPTQPPDCELNILEGPVDSGGARGHPNGGFGNSEAF